MKRTITALAVAVMFMAPALAFAECSWVLWGQDKSFWSYKLLNVLPGPTRSNTYVVAEHRSMSDCLESKTKRVSQQIDVWNLPEVKKDIEAFGGLRRVSYYACVPLPLKPERIDDAEWK